MPEKFSLPEKLPGLVESFGLMKQAEASLKGAEKKAAIEKLSSHISFLQNGAPVVKQDAKYLVKIFSKQTELGRQRRLENLAKSNKDVDWLLEQYQALIAVAKPAEPGETELSNKTQSKKKSK